MASILSHPAVPLAIGVAAGPRTVPPALVAAGCVASILPDADSVGFWLGVPYDAPLGHRGFTHSLCFAALVALGCALFSSRLGAPAATVFAVVFVSTASHGVLDALTTGGMGVAFFSPLSNARFFLPWRVITVSPIGVTPFLSARGARVLRSELVWIWMPAAFVALAGLAARRLWPAG
jgi:inner membrane protein